MKQEKNPGRRNFLGLAAIGLLFPVIKPKSKSEPKLKYIEYLGVKKYYETTPIKDHPEHSHEIRVYDREFKHIETFNSYDDFVGVPEAKVPTVKGGSGYDNAIEFELNPMEAYPKGATMPWVSSEDPPKDWAIMDGIANSKENGGSGIKYEGQI